MSFDMPDFAVRPLDAKLDAEIFDAMECISDRSV
jgi:hypothetical protein